MNMTDTKPFRRIAPLRHAVTTLIGVERDLAWLRSQLVVYTANNLRARHRRVLQLIEKNPDHTGAKAMLSRMKLHSQRRRGAYSEKSLEAFVEGTMLHNTYLWTGGGGASEPVRFKNALALIKRARRLTLGSNNIEWFMNGVATELMRTMGEGFEVSARLTSIQIDDRGTLAEAIMFKVYFVTLPSAQASSSE